MATFRQSLENATSSDMSVTASTSSATPTRADEGNSGIALASIDPDEGYIKDSRYTWINDYTDNDYSFVDEYKNVTLSQNQINLTKEENSQVIPFAVPRFYDGVDLSQMLFKIHYVNADGFEMYSTPINVMIGSDKIRFYWLLDGLATSVKGVLKFEIIATGTITYQSYDSSTGSTTEYSKDYRWSTRPKLEGLNVLESLSGSGTIEPTVGWDTYLDQVSNLVDQANTASASARRYATDAASSASRVNEAIAAVSTTISQNVEAQYEETFANYYTKVEVDQKFTDFDISDQLTGIQDQLDNMDGLADLEISYVENTNTLTFTNGKTASEIASYVINPSATWTTAFRESINSDTSEAVNTVQTALDEYINTNNAAVQANAQAISAVETDLENNYYDKTAIDAKVSDLATASDLSTVRTNLTRVESASATNTSNISVITNKITEIENAMNNVNTDPSVRYRASYNAETGLYSLLEVTTGEDDQEVQTPVSQFVISGGGGGGTSTSTTVTIERITSSPITITKENRAIIQYSFSSVDSSGDNTGEGTATWKVGNSVVATSIALQGNNSFDITDYVGIGTQKVTLTIIDAAGTLAVKNWTVQVIDIRLESSFNDTYTYPIGEVSFDYIPYGSIEKTIHFKIDNVEIGTVVTSSSGIPMSYTLPEQEHGAHLLEAYITAELNGTSIETNHIYKDIIWYDDSSDVPVIGCVFNEFTAKQYDSTNIKYVVYDPNTDNPRVSLSIDGQQVSNLTLEQPVNIWQYKSSDVGPHTLTITCRDVVKTIHATIEELDIAISPVTANLAFDFNPSGYSNNSENRLWKDTRNESIAMTVSDNFDWVNGGYQLDGNGDQYFCVKAGTTATISYNLFADDARRNGKEFKLVFKTSNVRKSNATFLSCQSGTTLVGLQMNVHEAYVKATGDSLYIPYSEEDIIEFEFNINKQEDIPLVMSYEDGVGFRPMLYTSDYSFTQSSPVPITVGSPDCDVWIYRMKAYSASLSDSGILSNFIADARNADEMIARYRRNQIYNENNQLTPESVAQACPHLKVIKLDCPHFTNDKKDFVLDTTIECIHVGGDPKLDNWKATNAAHSGQGTTSNEYGQAGRNLDFLMCFDGNYRNKNITYNESYKTKLVLGDGTTYEDGTGKITLTRNSVPANYLNLKVNVASSEMQNNRLGQKFYNDFLPYMSVAQKKDPKVKNSMEFVNCVVFVRENDTTIENHREFDDCEWHFYAIGNLGDSKKTDYTRVNDATDPKEFVVEIMDNTLPNSTFSGTEEALAALEADVFDEKGTYGFRYEMSGISSEQQSANIEKWKEFYRFVATSTDEYFVAHLSDWFILDSALYFYLFTERYTMIDNRAKNTFWHHAKIYITQSEAELLGENAKYYTVDDNAAAINDGYRFDFWAYDFDTQLSINNSGEMTIPYGKEDTDYRTDGVPSSGYIYNGAESKFFCRIRDLMYDRLQQMYLQLESENCWSAERLITAYDEAQAEFPEELWRLLIERFYIRTWREGTERFLKSMMNGRKKYQRRQFERDQEKYFGTKYYGTNVTSDQIMFRCNTPISAAVTPNYTLHLVPYSDMYLSVMFGATHRTQIRAKAGVSYDIECPFATMDDTAVLIYCASRIQSVGDLSACYIHDNDFSKAEKLKVLILGNDTEGYSNEFLTNLVIGNNKLLEYLDIRNNPNLTSSVNLTACNNLEEFYAEGSGISGVAFANGGNLRIAHIPAITSLNVKNLNHIEDFQISSFDNLQTLIIENTPAISTYEYVTSSPNLTNVRLIGIDWGIDEGISNTSILDRLIRIAGIDGSGYNTLVSVLIGTFYSPTVKQKLLDQYNDAWADLEITYDTLVTQYTVTFVNDDNSVLDVQYVDVGESAVDPVTRENNPIPIPQKESSVSTNYTYYGWNTTLSAIFSDRTIKAVYTESVREYTVKYVARGYVKQTTTAPYGSSVSYTGEIPVYTDEESAYTYYLFTGWDQFGYVDGDKTINAVYDRFTYTEGCLDNIEIADMRPVQIYAMIKIGIYNTLMTIKDPVSFNMGADYSYDNIEQNLLINNETVFTGTNYVDTGINLLDEDDNWTIAVDYMWGSNNSSNAVLMQCYKGDGSNGFRIIQSGTPSINWGTSSTPSATSGKRDIVVLRHIKGETKIHVYKGNIPAESIDYLTLNSNRATAPNSSLVFGCSKADDGVYENYAKGTIYWCKLWRCDLGDNACRSLAAWTHERIDLEIARYRAYYLSDGTGRRSSITFLSSKLLENTMPLSSLGSNSGGWAEASLNRLLNNRFYNAIPVEWKQLIKQVKIASSIGNKSTEISTSDNYVTIPAVYEIDSNRNTAPFNNEATETISYLTDNNSRIRRFENGTAGDYWTRSPSVNYSTYFFYVQNNGEVTEYSYPSTSKGVCIELSI